MIASEVMTSPVISAREDTPVQDIARLLLQNHISANPILDDHGAPVGMVSEGDLIGRDQTERDERRDWWLALLAEGETLGPDFLSSLTRPQRVARDVMSKPAVTVGADDETHEIARLLIADRIKRVPVVRNGQMVGIVSRENLLRAFAHEEPRQDARPREGAVERVLDDALAPLRWRFERPRPAATPHTAPAARLDEASSAAEDFRRLAEAFEKRQALQREELRHSAQDKQKHEVDELIGKHMSDESWRDLIHQARAAAGQGLKEFLLLRFPSQLCSDSGRAVNVPDPEWPETLRGEAAEIYLRWNHDLRPHGFHVRARVLDFPDGLPGDIGLFLAWAG